MGSATYGQKRQQYYFQHAPYGTGRKCAIILFLLIKGQKILDGTVNGVKQQFKENLFVIGAENYPLPLTSPAFEVVHTGRTGW